MERAAIIIAVIVAFVFAAAGAGAFRVQGLNFGAFGRAAPQVDVAAGRLEPTTYAALSVDLEHAAAVVRVLPEDRSDISIEIDNPGRTPMPEVRLSGGALRIDGRLQGRILNCRDDGGVDLLGYGGASRTELPVITLRMPRAVDFSAGGAVQTEIGPAESAELRFSGCGDAEIGAVAGAVSLRNSGSGDVRGASAGSLEIDNSGSGGIIFGDVAGPVEADLAGSGGVSLGAVGGGLDVDLSGSGGVRAASLAGPLDVTIAGSGDVTVASGMLTLVDIAIAGSGDIQAAAASAQTAKVSIAGSGDVTLGDVRDLEVEIAGSGDVRVASLSGRRRERIAGSGDVIVGP